MRGFLRGDFINFRSKVAEILSFEYFLSLEINFKNLLKKSQFKVFCNSLHIFGVQWFECHEARLENLKIKFCTTCFSGS
jgi:hypothetical protein